MGQRQQGQRSNSYESSDSSPGSKLQQPPAPAPASLNPKEGTLFPMLNGGKNLVLVLSKYSNTVIIILLELFVLHVVLLVVAQECRETIYILKCHKFFHILYALKKKYVFENRL